jgi:hypothetical protein
MRMDSTSRVVAPAGGRWWPLRVQRDGREQHVSLGTFPDVGLDDARARATQLRAGHDPLDQVFGYSALSVSIGSIAAARRAGT